MLHMLVQANYDMPKMLDVLKQAEVGPIIMQIKKLLATASLPKGSS